MILVVFIESIENNFKFLFFRKILNMVWDVDRKKRWGHSHNKKRSYWFEQKNSNMWVKLLSLEAVELILLRLLQQLHGISISLLRDT